MERKKQEKLLKIVSLFIELILMGKFNYYASKNKGNTERFFELSVGEYFFTAFKTLRVNKGIIIN